jgi:hypothetical protein
MDDLNGDICWRDPETFKLDEDIYAAILLVQKRDDSYETVMAFQDNGVIYLDAPLSCFTYGVFNSTNYRRLAVVDYVTNDDMAK